MSGIASRVLRFGVFEVDLRTGELRRQGLRLRLPSQSFQVLALLLEHPGNLVSREDLRKKLWPADTFVDFDHGVNAAVNRLREALGDSAERPKFIETLPRRGYRFIVPLEGNSVDSDQQTPISSATAASCSEPNSGVGDISEIKLPARAPAPGRRLFHPIIASLIAIAVLGAGWLLRTPLPPPKIVRAVQLTSDGLEKGGEIVTDGRRIYFTERVGERSRLAGISVSGGEVVPIRTSVQDPQVVSISPDTSELLVVERSIFEENPLWLVPVQGGSPRRLGDVLARGASWSADGQKLAYVHGNDVYLAKRDGTEPHKLPLMNSDPAVWPWLPTWSPEGKRLRFDRYTMNQHTCALWEFTERDGNIHKVFPGSETPQRCMGVWTGDGKYYLFQSWEDLAAVPGGAPVTDIWAIREESSFFHKTNREPVQLTTGPAHFRFLQPSSDGKAIFALGYIQARGELTRYDAKTQRFSLYLSGISADGVNFSRDGAWMAYVKYPQGELWRSRADGSEALQLTFPPLIAYGPSWSPDGKRIAFCGQKAGTVWQPYVVSADGSTQQLRPEAPDGNDPTWSPDGNLLALGPVDMSRNPNVRILDLNSHRLTVVPGSEGVYAPRWSPDGQHISAISATEAKLMLFDLKSQTWTLQAKTDVGWGAQRWSRDGKYIYFASLGSDPGIFRVAITNNRSERVVSLNGFRPAGRGWFTLGPGDEPLLLRDITASSEIYALQWVAP